MNAAARNDRVFAARDLGVRLARERGGAESISGSDCRLLVARIGDLMLAFRTPFQPLPADPPAPSYQAALVAAGKQTKGYGLDIWFRGRKVLNLEWDEPDDLDVRSYKPGPWEEAMSAHLNGGQP
jgi:hypothetical protein